MNMVNSHIQMPRCVLKNFEDDKQTLYYYDFKSKNIKRGRAASLNTEFGYYSLKTENYLRDHIEAPFGKVMAYLKKITVEDTFALDNLFIEDIRNFLYALLSRGTDMISSINRNSVFFQFFQKREQHDYAVTKGIKLAKERDLLKDWEITFLINDSNVPFILPLQGIYQFGTKRKGCSCLNFPITPNLAITLFHKNYTEWFVENGVVKLFYLTEDEDAQILNLLAFRAEENYNKKCVISNKKEELEILINKKEEIELLINDRFCKGENNENER